MRTIALVLVNLALGLSAWAESAIIDPFQYASDAAAQAVWKPMKGSQPVTCATVEGKPCLRLPCNFAPGLIERASWDRKVTLDLTTCQGISMDVFCRQVTPVSHFVFFFQSGDGWYSAGFHPTGPGWSTINIDKSSMHTEGKPAGWSKLSTIRISAYRGQNQDTEFYVGNLTKRGALGEDALLAVIRPDNTSARSEAKVIGQVCETVVQYFANAGVQCAVLSDRDASPERLSAAKAVILPYAPGMSDELTQALLNYLSKGGKLMAFYTLPPKLYAACGLQSGPHLKADPRGLFSSLHFAAGALPGTPAVVQQSSWNIHDAKPASASGRILAEWHDAAGKPTGHAAVIGTPNCIFMTHIILEDDSAAKQRMLMAMAGSLVPELWRRAAENGIQGIGRVGPFKDFAAMSAWVESNKRPAALKSLGQLKELRASALALSTQGKFAESVEKAAAARQIALETFCSAEKPLPGEFRAFWCHKADGVTGMDWDAAIKNLADNGFTAIFPNMLWGGSAFYPSDLLPRASETDQIAQCLAACRKHGLQIHVWKVNWNLGHTVPKEFVERMRRENRLQVGPKGQKGEWLCPSHPENQKLEIAAMLEVARKYDVDGIHFDYIRYPDGDHCYCDGCKERFQAATKITVKNWPDDVASGGSLRQPWNDWRRNNITTVVKGVSEQVRPLKPKLKISAAVFRVWTTDRDGVAQDWKVWCDKGYVDFLCPMDYTENDGTFENQIVNQKIWAGKVPIYPGIGAASSHSDLTPDHVIAQINITRKQNTGGFIIFNYGAKQAKDLVPMLGKGITAKQP